MSEIVTTNEGPLIVDSTYWGSDYDRADKLFASVNAGTIRILFPQALHQLAKECQGAEYVILSRGPRRDKDLADAVEIMWEDHSDAPFALHLSPTSFDQLPAEPPAGQQWRLAVWELVEGQPHLACEHACHWRRVPHLPWLKPLGEK
jgi:hypothetical protein